MQTQQIDPARRCILVTVRGELDAVAMPPSKDWAGRDVIEIRALDGSFSMPVLQSWAEHKLSQDRGYGLPEFYAC